MVCEYFELINGVMVCLLNRVSFPSSVYMNDIDEYCKDCLEDDRNKEKGDE